ncbi:MAG TPA: bluetail domain-containing putative surface protein [Rhizomicrobium sp.]|nr:bluetail domain-containing putative surface protein [Rhizomicrobium sp.]
MTIFGTSGDDNLTGTSGDDYFDLRQGGHDTASGLGGDDTFFMGGNLDPDDRLDGGTGTDSVILSGNYSRFGGLHINSTIFTSIEDVVLKGPHHMVITLDAGAAPAGETLTVDARQLAVTDSTVALTLDATAATDGNYIVKLGSGTPQYQVDFGAQLKATDHIDGGAGYTYLYLDGDYDMRFTAKTIHNIANFSMDATHSYRFVENDANLDAGFTMQVGCVADVGQTDNFNGSAETDGAFSFVMGAGTMLLKGGAGDDVFGGAVTAADRISGGAGNDTLYYDGGDAGGDNFHKVAQGIETVVLSHAGGNYSLYTKGHVADAGKDLTVDASDMTGAQNLTLNDANDTGGIHLVNGANDLIATGSMQADSFDLTGGGTCTVYAAGGADTIMADSSAHEHFVYKAAGDSTSTGYDTISGVNFATDEFNVHAAGGAVVGVDSAVTGGALSTATFDSDLAAAIGAGQMTAHTAVLFTADSGTLSGHTFLVVDENGTAGYQAGADLVIDVTGATGTLALGDFG